MYSKDQVNPDRASNVFGGLLADPARILTVVPFSYHFKVVVCALEFVLQFFSAIR